MKDNAVAIITARGGSKRIPGKNIRPFCGKPILAYSIEAALESGVFDEVMVSTDSDPIAEAALRYGAKVPFRRSAKMAGDYATTDEVIAEVLEEYDRRMNRGFRAAVPPGGAQGARAAVFTAEAQGVRAAAPPDGAQGARINAEAPDFQKKSKQRERQKERDSSADELHYFQNFCCIYPTAPFLTPGRLREAMELLKEHESVLPVVRFSYPPQRGFVIRRNGQDSCDVSGEGSRSSGNEALRNLEVLRNPEKERKTGAGRVVRWMPEYAAARSQDLEPVYHDAGQFYACRTDAFFRGCTTDVDDMVPLILPETEVQDIDTPEDWEIAEEKYRYLHKRGID